jgi:hypothetical protein
LSCLWLLLLLTSACGDLQDPAGGMGQITTPQMALTQPTSLEEAAPTSINTPAAGTPAPAPLTQAPAVTSETIATPVPSTLSPSVSPNVPPVQVAPTSQPAPPLSTTSPSPISPAKEQPVRQLPWPAFDDVPRQNVTLSWEPSERADGYKVHLSSLSSSVFVNYDVGPATELIVQLRLGEKYAFSVAAYNHAGFSATSDRYTFNLF